MHAFVRCKENVTGGKASVGNGRDDSHRGWFVINIAANTVVVMNHGFDRHISWWFMNTPPSLRSTFFQVQEFWQSVTWFWGGEAILEERPETAVKLDWKAEVKEQVDKKTDTMEQQAMLQEKVAEKIWDLRRWLLSTKNFTQGWYFQSSRSRGWKKNHLASRSKLSPFELKISTNQKNKEIYVATNLNLLS